MSVQWSAPPSSSSTLEAKMEELRCKVEQLLSERSCVMCGLCVRHQEAQAAQISIFSSLDHKLTEMRSALEELAHGLEDKQCERTSVPLVALQRRKSLPVRTSAEEVYVRLSAGRDGKNASYEKGLLGEINKTNRIKRENHSAKSALSEVKVHPDAKLKSKVELENSQTRTDTAKHQQAKKPCMTENKSQNDAKTFFMAAGAATHKTQAVIPPREEVKDDTHPSAKKTLPDLSDLKRAESASKSTVNLKVPDFSGRPVTSTPCVVSPALHNPPKSTQSGVPTSSSPSEKCTKTCVPQSLGKPPVNAAKTKTPTPQDSTLLPAKPTSFNTNPAALRHVHSCPNALQRSQVTADSGNAVNHTAGGVQITVTPAADKILAHLKDRSPPKTCSKMIDDVSPQPAPFPHRFVSLKSSPPPCDTFSIHTREVLGGGRFGKVHKCTEVVKGLRLAAKIINTRNPREREMAVNEIQVMNQLSHANVLQLYDAFEIKNQVVLILEFVEGGELFERIVDESCFLTEVDAMVFVKQICEGVQYMHQMYVLHLDLKPENILLVNRCSHQVKIIDFGLARRYKPREKLKVSFGTPEFLAPEVVNFDFVSFPTDMWTLGVVTYMLLSGLSPFLGDDDSQTLNNVLMGNWYFDEDAFEHVSAEARDFVTNLLIRERSGRLSATQCLKHPWLNNISEKAKSHNIVLKSQVLLKKYMARRLWKKNYIAIAAANRFKKIGSSGSLTSMGF